MPLNDREPAYWFTLASHDSESAKIIMDHHGPAEMAIYHLHQSMEKQLKGLILLHHGTFPFIHDLERLYKLLCSLDQAFNGLLDPIIELNSFYLETRYPQSEFLTQDDASKAKQAFDTIQQALL